MATVAQRSFAAGEISPALYARVDQTRYTTGLRQCRNTVILRTGGSSMRPGTNFIAECATSANPSRLLPFVSSASQAYIVELGESGYARFYKNGAQILNAPLAISNITNANSAVVTINNHGLHSTDEVQIFGVLGMTQLNGRNFKIANITTNTFSLNYMNGQPVDSTAFGTYSSSASAFAAAVYSVYHGYTPDVLAKIQFVQSADVMTLTVRGYAVKQIKHFSDLNWQILPLGYGPMQQGVSNITASTASGSTTITTTIGITAVSSLGEESLVASSTITLPAPHFGLGSANNPWALGWNPPADAGGTYSFAPSYNVYVLQNGVYGFVGQAAANFNGSTATYGFNYYGTDGPTPIFTQTPPLANSPPDTYAAIGTYQQRLLLGSGVKNPAGTITSKIGFSGNFSNGIAVADSNSINFTILGRLVQEIRAYLDIGSLVVLTNEGEFVVEGNASGVITPTAINVRQTSFIGSGTLTPLVIGNSAIFIQARGSAVFDLGYDFEVKGFNGNELTIFANHLVDNFQITAWAYQKRPHSVVWAVRSDGILLSMTYVKGESIVAWARHDTAGFVEDVTCIPEGTSDAVYVIVRRTVKGVVKRYIERMASNADGDFLNSVYSDCSVSYNGANLSTSTVTATLSGGVNWTYDETLTITSSLVDILKFSSSDVGSEVVLTGADGLSIRFVINSVTSQNTATGHANKTVPQSLRNTAVTTWAKGLKVVSGLWALEGQKVSVVGDGFVVANPNRMNDFQVTVTNGQATLDKAYTNIHIGLPFIADIETLDIDTTQGEPLVGKEILISTVHAHVQNTRGFFAGAQPPTNDLLNPLENLTEVKPRNQLIENMNQPASMKTTVVELNIQGTYSRGGRTFIRQIDPVPTSILAVEPAGFIQTGGR